MKSRTQHIPRPVPPPNRLICDVCGELVNGIHTNWICKFFVWLDKWKLD